MKKILVLGGNLFQLPAIKYAKKRGYYVITCDYLPDNPGHKYADEYHNISTTDKEAVLKLAKELSIDGILCFCSDPAAPTDAYVTDKMGITGNPYEKIKILAEKHYWRKFLSENNFCVPKAKAYTLFEEIDLDFWNYPVMVKPVDSSGSKGITKVYDKDKVYSAFNYALSYSRNKIIIIEDYIEKIGYQIGGDGFYGKNKLEYG